MIKPDADEHQNDRNNEEQLFPDDATRFESLEASVNHLVADVPGIQFAGRRLGASMSLPSASDGSRPARF